MSRGSQSYEKPPFSVKPALGLDPRDTVDVAHGHQKMTVWNTHYGERCFLPIHIYDTATGRPVTMILRPGKTPSGAEVRRWLRRLVKRIRRHWPNTHIIIRGDGHYGRAEAMSWCEDNGVDYIFGFAGNSVLDRLACRPGALIVNLQRVSSVPGLDEPAATFAAGRISSFGGNEPYMLRPAA